MGLRQQTQGPPRAPHTDRKVVRWCRTQASIRKASLMARSVRILRHQTGAQYSVVEWAKTKMAVCNVVASAPQPDLVLQLTASP